MQYILQNTDIFDEEIDQKFKAAINNDKDAFNKEKAYIFKVSFHVNLLNDSRFDEFNILVPSKASKGTREYKIGDVMSFQLKKMEQVLNENEIKSYSTTIQGDYLDTDNIIKIEILEDTSEPTFTGRGKKKSRIKVSSIIPSLPSTQENISKLASERINKIYWGFMGIIKSKKIMSEILNIDDTENDEEIFKAFVNQYGELWLTTNEREKELMRQLKEKALSVVGNCIGQQEKV